MDEESIMYLSITSMLVLIVIFTSSSYGSFKDIAIALAGIALAAILAIEYVDYLIFPAMTGLLNIKMIPAKNYTINKSQNALLKNVSGIYYATGYVTANIYKYVFEAEIMQENEEQRLADAPDIWERMVMSVRFPFKFHLISMSQDVQSFRDELEGKRGFLEFQLGKEMSSGKPSQMAIQDLQRRINILQTRIDRISAGERPVNALMYIETVAVGVSEKEALDNLSSQIAQIQTTFNAFDLSTTRVVGREMYELFTLNYRLEPKGRLGKVFNTQK